MIYIGDIMRKITAVLLVLTVLFALLPNISANAYSDDEQTVRIGLYYGSTALTEAKLQNVDNYGEGYILGMTDKDSNFTPFCYISDVYLSMVCGNTYHVLVPDPYYTYDEAAAAASMYSDAFVRCVDGLFYVLIGSYGTAEGAQSAAAAFGGNFTSCGCHSNTVTVKNTHTGSILFQFRCSDSYLAIKPVFPNGTWFSDDMEKRAITWFKANQYRGIFEYRTSGSAISVINILSMSDYIKGVVPYEMSGSWPLEALKAQALCARTYAVANLGKHRSSGFDLCASTCCQAYKGEGSANNKTAQAVDETAGQYITYDGEPINAVYCSSNGGATENCENVWSQNVPYLRAVRDDFEQYVNTGYASWGYTITLSQISSILRSRGNSFSGSIVRAWADYSEAGNVIKLHFIDSAGKDISYSGESCRTLFNTSSSGIKIYSQRYIFEDAANPRVTSNAQITNIGAASSPVFPSASTAAAASSYVLTGSGLVSSSSLYSSSVPILTSDGIDKAVSFYTTSGGYVPSYSDLDNISASALEPPAYCSGTFTISGSGWGHNLGMSQYGAKAMAELGYTADEIIRFYYTNVTISTIY